MRGSFSIRPCALRQVHAVEARSDCTFARHWHDEYGIGLIVGGAQRSWSGRGAVEAQRGNLITCNPGEVHDGAPIGGSRQWRMLYLAPSRVAAIVTDIREGASPDFEFTEPVIGNSSLAETFSSVYDALTGRWTESARAEECMILLLARLLSPRLAPRGAPPAVARAKARIDEEPIPSVTLGELAREAGMSRFQLLRGFARSYGLTPHAYIVQRRLDAARRLIASGTALAAVAGDCGFADQSHLGRLFVRRYGLTPGAYAEATGARAQFRSIPGRTRRALIDAGRNIRPANDGSTDAPDPKSRRSRRR